MTALVAGFWNTTCSCFPTESFSKKREGDPTLPFFFESKKWTLDKAGLRSSWRVAYFVVSKFVLTMSFSFAILFKKCPLVDFFFFAKILMSQPPEVDAERQIQGE